MIVRDFNPASKDDGVKFDAAMDDNMHGNVVLLDDYIMVADPGTDLPFSGVIVARPVMYIHELVLRPSLIRRSIGESLVAHALSKGAMLGEKYAHFTVAPDNTAMHTLMREYRAVRQPDGVIYSLAIPPSHYPAINRGRVRWLDYGR